MTKIYNLTKEKGISMMEFVVKAAASNQLSKQTGIPPMEAKKIIEAAFDKGVPIVIDEKNSVLPSEKDIPEGMTTVIEFDENNELKISYISKEEHEQQLYSNRRLS